MGKGEINNLISNTGERKQVLIDDEVAGGERNWVSPVGLVVLIAQISKLDDLRFSWWFGAGVVAATIEALRFELADHGGHGGVNH